MNGRASCPHLPVHPASLRVDVGQGQAIVGQFRQFRTFHVSDSKPHDGEDADGTKSRLRESKSTSVFYVRFPE